MTARDAVADVAPLLAVLPPVQRVALPRAAAPVLDLLTSTLGLPGVEVVGGTEGLSAGELVLTGRLSRADWAAPLGPVEPLPEPVVVTSADGSPLRCHVSGPAGAPAMAVVPACGMPSGLTAGWVRALQREHRVLTWDTRGLFGVDPDFDARRTSVVAQARDLVAALDAFDLADAHVVGLCGGAPVAMAATAATDRITSLSLWHGDYELGGDAPKTDHQKDVQRLLGMAGRSRGSAAGLHAMFRRPAAVATLRADIAHHLYYPYATAELLYRYGLLNGAIMTTDCRPLARAVDVPTLVVTSDADTTAHPAGSAWVAAAAPAAKLVRLPAGDHLSAFGAAPHLVTLAVDFPRGRRP